MTRLPPRLLIVTSQNTTVALQLVRALLRSDIQPHVRVLFEQQIRTFGRRFRAQWRQLRRNGLIWIPYRVIAFVRDMLRTSENVESTLLDGFADLTREFGDRFSARVVPNVHDVAVLADVRNAAPDLGIVFGTRILQASLFTIPRLGMVNIHQGKLPDYRGMPPGFWELYNGEQSAGVTLHTVATELDAGGILFQQTIEIRPHDTLASLQSRLESVVLENIAGWTALVLSNQICPQPQQPSGKTYTAPTVYQRFDLWRRLRRPVQKRSPH